MSTWIEIGLTAALTSLVCCAGSSASGDATPSSVPTRAGEAEAEAELRAAQEFAMAENDSTNPDHGQPLRVLVTGFNDWKDLGDPPNVWRCRDNPSCRLLLGAETSEPQDRFGGPLADRLRTSDPDDEVSWTFATLPVTWEIAKQVPRYEDYDTVIHLGLGVYDRLDTIFVEDGAFNRRRGTDAAGRKLDEPIVTEVGKTLSPADPRLTDRIRALDGKEFAGYRVEVKAAREGNSYLCNETHFWALQALQDSKDAGGKLRAAYFVHIPYAADGDYEALANGVADLVTALVR